MKLKEKFEEAALADPETFGKMTFSEFGKWQRRQTCGVNHFSVQDLVQKEDLTLRDLAVKHDIPLIDVEQVHRVFHDFDLDGSGLVEMEEFVNILHELLRVPKSLEIPKGRIEKFWREVDRDGNGGICFEEYLVWYNQYFGHSTAMDPIQAFYASFRPHASPRNRDFHPPPSPKSKKKEANQTVSLAEWGR